MVQRRHGRVAGLKSLVVFRLETLPVKLAHGLSVYLIIKEGYPIFISFFFGGVAGGA
jgi:hypothetical protein